MLYSFSENGMQLNKELAITLHLSKEMKAKYSHIRLYNKIQLQSAPLYSSAVISNAIRSLQFTAPTCVILCKSQNLNHFRKNNE